MNMAATSTQEAGVSSKSRRFPGLVWGRDILIVIVEEGEDGDGDENTIGYITRYII